MPSGITFNMRIFYRVDARVMKNNLCNVSLIVEDFPDDTMVVSIPSWVPGSYVIRDYGRLIRNVNARTPEGFRLGIKKRDKGSWIIDKGANSSVIFEYSVFTGDLIPQMNHINDDHAYLLGAALFVYIERYREQSSEIEILHPDGTRLITSLDNSGDERYHANNYDSLADSVIEIGKPQTMEFSVDDHSHQIVFCGFDDSDIIKKVAIDAERIVKATRQIFGSIPYKRYTFFIHVVDGGVGHGHEHSSSSSIVVGRDLLYGEGFQRFLSVLAHEFFHVYNVKRIKPIELELFDYGRENYTEMLWFSEGFTTYYADLILFRAGLISQTDYLMNLAELLRIYELIPGRNRISASSSSFDAWIRLYKPSPDDFNTYVSYYLKGAIIATMMNARIVLDSGAKYSLDDFMLELWNRYRKDGRGITEQDQLSVLRELTGNDYTEFFDKYVHGTHELNIQKELGRVGLSIKAEYSDENGSENAQRSSGILLKRNGDKFIVVTCISGFPAYGSGISPGDKIRSLNGKPFSERNTFPISKMGNRDLFFDRIVDASSKEFKIQIERFGSVKTYRIKGSLAVPIRYSLKFEGVDSEKTIFNRFLRGHLLDRML